MGAPLLEQAGEVGSGPGTALLEVGGINRCGTLLQACLMFSLTEVSTSLRAPTGSSSWAGGTGGEFVHLLSNC